DQFTQVHQNAEPLRGNGVSHCRTHADGCKQHYVICELEHDLRQAVHRADNWFAFFPNGWNGECEEHAECDDLQYIAAHHGLDNTGGKHVHDWFDQSLRMSLSDCLKDVVVC